MAERTPGSWIPRKLITRYTIVTGAVLLVTMGFFAVFSVHYLERIFLENAIANVDHLSQTLISTTYYQMLEDDRQRVYQMMEEVGGQTDVEAIKLFTKEGLVIFSTCSDEIGSTLSVDSEGCTSCHLDPGTAPLTEASSHARSRFFEDPGGSRLLGVTKAIYNEKPCFTADCHFHNGEDPILGILDVTVPLEGINAAISGYKTTIAVLTTGLLALMIFSLALLTQKLVSRPVRKLLEHTGRVAQGHLDSRLTETGDDEIGELALAFNQMTENLEKTRRELKTWAATLEGKVEERTRAIQDMQARVVRSEKLASLGETVAGIAHEINNPLTGILIFAAMIKDSPRLDPALREDMETILRETERCAGIVRELLDFARESKPRKKLESVNRIMEKTFTLLEQQAAFQNIRIVRNYRADLPPVYLDPNQIAQVFMNILLNAGQAMEEGGRLTVTTGIAEKEESLYVSISDTGPGIPESHLGRIFDPFFSTKGHQGTGLGLSVSHGIVQNHGGQIEVQSRIGEGTTFIIRLPLQTVESRSETRGGADPALL